MTTYNNCINIIEDKKTLTHGELMTKWETFKNKYPKLYEMLTLTDTIDLEMLKFLCNSSENFTDLSKEELLDKEFKIGDELAKKYIYNQFPEPNSQQKEFIKNNLRKKLNNGKSYVQEDFQNKK